MNEFTEQAMELQILAKAAFLVDHDDEAFGKLSKAYMTICGHPPFSGFDDYSYDGAVEKAEIQRGWVLAARKLGESASGNPDIAQKSKEEE